MGNRIMRKWIGAENTIINQLEEEAQMLEPQHLGWWIPLRIAMGGSR